MLTTLVYMVILSVETQFVLYLFAACDFVCCTACIVQKLCMIMIMIFSNIISLVPCLL